MKTKPLVSIIMPAYNAAAYMKEAIESVILQTYSGWELLIINDGSTDATEQIAKSFGDERIQYFHQSNQGVSAARNKGLSVMKGDYFCFLDADDKLTAHSLASRLEVFNKNPEVAFVDGLIEIRNGDLSRLVEYREQTFQGNPLSALVKLDSTCFFGPSWMVKVKPGRVYQLKEGMTHAEDLLFYIDIARDGLYAHTKETVLIYRKNEGSAMSNLKGLEEGYKTLYREIKAKKKKEGIRSADLYLLKGKLMKIMLLSYWGRRQFVNGVRVLGNYLWL